MEPLSIWAFTVIAAALGIGLSVVGKKKSGTCCSSKPAAAPLTGTVKSSAAVKKADDIVDVEKEKAIDALIAENK